jgi:hypothetical protein
MYAMFFVGESHDPACAPARLLTVTSHAWRNLVQLSEFTRSFENTKGVKEK